MPDVFVGKSFRSAQFDLFEQQSCAKAEFQIEKKTKNFKKSKKKLTKNSVKIVRKWQKFRLSKPIAIVLSVFGCFGQLHAKNQSFWLFTISEYVILLFFFLEKFEKS